MWIQESISQTQGATKADGGFNGLGRGALGGARGGSRTGFWGGGRGGSVGGSSKWSDLGGTCPQGQALVNHRLPLPHIAHPLTRP